MAMPTLMQEIEKPIEELAKSVAVEFHCNGQEAAGKIFGEISKREKLTHGEAAALSHIASCMIHGRKWKK